MKSTMKSTARRHVLAAALLLAAPWTQAATPDDAQVDRLLTVMRAQKTVEAIVPQVQASQQQLLAQLTAGQALTPEQRQRLDRIVYQSNAKMLGTLSWNNLQPLYRTIYRQTFSAADMEAMIGFYASPAGQNLLDKMPQLMHNTMTAMQDLMVPMMQQMQQDIAAEAASAQAGPVEQPASAPPTPGSGG